jgi:cation:H+ antiporter
MVLWMIHISLRRVHDPMEDEFDKEIPRVSTGKALFWFTLGLILLLGSSRLLVWGAVNIAETMGISDLIIGLTIVAIGTSLPELAASVISALRNEPDIAIGNVIGSNMFNLLAVLGLPGLIHPTVLEPEILSRDYSYMIGLSIALFVMAYGFRGQGRVNRVEGLLLLIAYFVYLGLLYHSVRS